MDELRAAVSQAAAMSQAVPLSGILGYLNLSTGKPDPRFQKQINDAYGFLVERGVAEPWRALHENLASALNDLHAKAAPGFGEAQQAAAVLKLTFTRVLPEYRRHHRDLLAHCSDADLFQPFFLARICEAVLAQQGPWDDEERIVGKAVRQVNDFVGHRPIAILETRPRGEPYDHERLRPVPLFIRGAGAAWGPYQSLVLQALEILEATPPGILQDAHFDPARVDELALDVRAYDFNHPADKRPNYQFGEWDPHVIDGKGFYRRFVVRKILLDGLLEWVKTPGGFEEWQAAAVLAGTTLMASGVSGAGPETHDSSVTLATLVPHIARYRDAFYAHWLGMRTGLEAQQLSEEAEHTRQPLGGVRQHLNQFMARQRAWQLQQRRLALLFADIGQAEAGRRQAAKIDVPSVRFLTEIHLRIKEGQGRLDRGDVAGAAELVPDIEDLLERGIACGAFIDPWNILGFQANYPRFTALEDSVHDARADELIHVMEEMFGMYFRVLSDGAALGERMASLFEGLRRRAAWWDRFATITVTDVPHVDGGEAAASAEHVARTLARWRERGQAADLAFWRQHIDDFRSPKAFALVVEALLRKSDEHAAMALLMSWLERHAEVALIDGDHSFHLLALRWMLRVCSRAEREASNALDEIARFFDYLEANAEELWDVPRLKAQTRTSADEQNATSDDADDSPYSAAYEGVTYRDSTDDEVEGEVLDFMPQKEFDLASQAEALQERLRFLATLSRLWHIASRAVRGRTLSAKQRDAVLRWLRRAEQNYQALLELADVLEAHEIPAASGSFEGNVEFNRRRTLKHHLLAMTLSAGLETVLVYGALEGALDLAETEDSDETPWHSCLVQLERALWQEDADAVRRWLPRFLRQFRSEPLLYVPLEAGGSPRAILRASLAQVLLRALAANLPRQGHVRETLTLLQVARQMEKEQPIVAGASESQFSGLFHVGFEAVIEAVVKATQDRAANDLLQTLRTLLPPFLKLWQDHHQRLKRSIIDTISDQEWAALASFIRRYGSDLFQPRFMAAANLRGIVDQGIGVYLDHLIDNPDPLHPVRLVEELDGSIPRRDAECALQRVFLIVLEHYAVYQDYRATATQADYGENLFQLLDFIRLKARCERLCLEMRPLALVHEVLARRRPSVAHDWQVSFEMDTREEAEAFLREYEQLRQRHGLYLRAVADRLQERFVTPLQVDQLCALVEPALEAAAKGESDPALEEAVVAFACQPTGVGMDVPAWLRRLEAEVERVRWRKSDITHLVETLFEVPQRALSWEELSSMLRSWGDS